MFVNGDVVYAQNFGDIDPEKPYRATLTSTNCPLKCAKTFLISVTICFLNII